jgi:hypothetical protein
LYPLLVLIERTGEMNRTKMISIKNRLGHAIIDANPSAGWPSFKGWSNAKIRKLARSMGVSIKGKG